METYYKATINFWLLAFFFAVILGSAGLGFLYMTRANYTVKAKIAENKEAARPADIDAIVLNDQNCRECFDVTPIFRRLESENVKIVSNRTVDRLSEEGKALIQRYAIEKLPTVILTGEVQKNNNLKNLLGSAGEVNGDTFVLRQIGGPYVVASTGQVKGKTALTLIVDSSCSRCYDAAEHQQILRQFGLNPEVKILDAGSAEARALINRYKITMVPTFVLTGEVGEYPAFTNIWPQVGIVKNGAYVFTQGVPSMGVYKDLKTRKVVDPAAAQSSSSTRR